MVNRTTNYTGYRAGMTYSLRRGKAFVRIWTIIISGGFGECVLPVDLEQRWDSANLRG